MYIEYIREVEKTLGTAGTWTLDEKVQTNQLDMKTRRIRWWAFVHGHWALGELPLSVAFVVAHSPKKLYIDSRNH